MTNPDKSQVVDVKGTKTYEPDKKPAKLVLSMAWFSLAKIALQAGAKDLF